MLAPQERAAKTFDVSAATKEKSVHTEVTADKKPAAAAKKAVKKLKA